MRLGPREVLGGKGASLGLTCALGSIRPWGQDLARMNKATADEGAPAVSGTAPRLATRGGGSGRRSRWLHTAAHGCTWFAGGCGWLWMADMGCRGLFRWLCCHLLCCGLWVALLSLSCRSLFTLSHTKYTPQPLSPPPGVRTIDRFFLGGPTSLRGFQERGVGPRAPIRAVSGASPYGDALGGDVSALASVALQLPLPSRRLQVRSLY